MVWKLFIDVRGRWSASVGGIFDGSAHFWSFRERVRPLVCVPPWGGIWGGPATTRHPICRLKV